MLRLDAEARRWWVRAVSTLLNTRIIRETPLRTHLNLAVVAALVSMWLISTAWIRPLALPDEGRYVGIAWEMLRSGDWLTPTLNGLPFFHKPPLFYWITAASMWLFGTNPWAARAAPMLGAWLGSLTMYLFVRRWSGQRAASLSLFALLAHPLFYVGSQFANMDMLVAGCISATILLFAHAALSYEHRLPHRRSLAWAYGFAALGVLAKGLIGIVIPLLVLFTWLAIWRRWHALRSLVWIPGLLIFAVAVTPWFIAMQISFPEFLDYFFVVQHFNRFASIGFNNVQPFWFYPAALLLFSLPWLPWLIRPLRHGYFSDGARAPVRLLMGLWVVMTTLFFSMPKSKPLGYILCAIAPLAFLIADGLLTIRLPSRGAIRFWYVSAGVSVVLALGAVVWFSVRARHSTHTLALELSARRAPQDAVVMLDQYYFDLPFYAKLSSGVFVVDDWASPDVHKHDNWRKELSDAGQFATAQAAAILIQPARLSAVLCRSRISWLIGAGDRSMRYPVLARAPPIFSEDGVVLWRVDASVPAVSSVLQCEHTRDLGTQVPWAASPQSARNR